MDRKDVLKRLLYPKCKSAIEFQFDSLRSNPLLYYITIQDIAQLNKIATSIKYSSKPKEKYAMIDKILTPRGFKKMASGTNRVTYRFLNDYNIVLKVAIDKVGLSDNGNEYKNQHLLKPFVTKCFDVSPCGTVGLFERVVPITSREEFENIAEDVFDLINNLIGKYVLEDIGEKFYMNYGLREGFGPVLLDYPYVFELDGRKLICNVTDPLEPLGYCGGEIDYDLGYNNLICTKCGKRYLATELKSDEKSDKPKIIVKGEDIVMKCVLKRGDEVVAKLNSEESVSVDTIPPRKKFDKMKGNLTRKGHDDNRKYHKPEIKTKDEVGLKVRLKGRPKSKNIDREAIRKDEKLERNTPIIPVSFDNQDIVENVDLSTLSCTIRHTEVKEETEKDFLSKVDEMDKNILPEKKYPIPHEEVGEPEPNNYENKETSKYDDGSFRAIIKGNEIWNLDTNELIFIIGDDSEEYETEDTILETEDEDTHNDEVVSYIPEDEKEETEEVNNEIPEEKIENTGFTIGDMAGDQLNKFTPNENYKTEKIISEVPNHFAANTKPVEEKPEVPTVVIHPRKRPEIKNEELEKLEKEF